jgi:hypothetical protein
MVDLGMIDLDLVKRSLFCAWFGNKQVDSFVDLMSVRPEKTYAVDLSK